MRRFTARSGRRTARGGRCASRTVHVVDRALFLDALPAAALASRHSRKDRRCPAMGARLLALVAVTLFAAVAAAKDLRVGTCQRDITPVTSSLAGAFVEAFGTPPVVNHTDPIFMAGFGNGREAVGYHDRLWARGIVVDGD